MTETTGNLQETLREDASVVEALAVELELRADGNRLRATSCAPSVATRRHRRRAAGGGCWARQCRRRPHSLHYADPLAGQSGSKLLLDNNNNNTC